MPLRCLIVDDNQAFLDAARLLLEREGLTVAGVASTGAEALSQAERLRPDVVLVDIALGRESGVDVVQQLFDGDLAPDATVILISTRSEEEVADLIDGSRAAGFLSKANLSAGSIRRIVDETAR